MGRQDVDDPIPELWRFLRERRMAAVIRRMLSTPWSRAGDRTHRATGKPIAPVRAAAACTHDVEAITEAGQTWERWACSMWFGTPMPAKAVGSPADRERGGE
jgi:hypothetical protein